MDCLSCGHAVRSSVSLITDHQSYLGLGVRLDLFFTVRIEDFAFNFLGLAILFGEDTRNEEGTSTPESGSN